MKMNRKILAIGTTIALAGLASQTATAVDGTGTATAFLVAPIAISETAQMDFGTISGGVGVGTVILDTAGGRVPGGDAQIIGTDGIAGEFTITGEVGTAYTITSLVGETATLDDGAAGAPMLVNNFQLLDDGNGVISSPEIINIGATLNLNAGQAAGTYTTGLGTGATYTVTVNYN